MATKISCAMLMLAVVTAVSSNTAVSGQESGSPRNLKPKVTVRRGQPKSGTIVVHDHRGRTLSGTTTLGGVRVPPPRRQPTTKKQRYGRRISVSELRKRLQALKNGKQSRPRKAGDKPTPQNNPELKSICDQLRALMRLISIEYEQAVLTSGRGAEADELQLLYDEAKRVARRIGCGGQYLSPKPGGLVIDKFKTKK